MKNINIAHIRASEFYGGPERAIIGQCKNHKQYNFFCVSFIKNSVKNEFLEMARSLGIEVYALRERFLADYLPIFHLANYIKQRNINILVSHDYKSCFYSIIVSRLMRIKHIRHFRGFTSEDRKVHFYNKLDVYMMKRVATLFAVSEKSADILAKLGIDRKKITIVPNAIDVQNLIGDDFNKACNQDFYNFVCGGRLSFEKGYDQLIEALKIVDVNYKNYSVDIYGEGPEYNNIIKLINDYNLQERIKLKGFVDDIRPIMRQATCLILPSRSEGMPNILLEAWSQKLAVISMSVGGVPEMISNKKDGIICEAGSISGLANGILEVIEGTVNSNDMGEAGYLKVKEKYSYTVQNKILANHYTTSN